MTQPTITYCSAAEELAELIRHGFENPEGISGRVLFHICAEELAHPLAIVFTDSDLDIRYEWLERPDSTLTLPLATAEHIASNITEVDFRDPEIVGKIHLDGDVGLIIHIVKSLLRPSQDTLERFDLAEHLVSDAYNLVEVPRFTNPSELEILESLALGRPMIITHLDMPESHHRWSLQRLVAEYGDVPLRVRSATHKETVAEFIERLTSVDTKSQPIIEGHTKAYTEGCSLPEPMHKDFLPNYFSRDDYIEPQIWLGAVPVNVPASSLHHDPLDGFLYQIMGRKKFVLYPPSQASNLYPMKAYNHYQACWVKPEAPDLERFPDFAQARGIEVVLKPGELLVQPAGWFHAVYCLDSPTFSVSYFLRH